MIFAKIVAETKIWPICAKMKKKHVRFNLWWALEQGVKFVDLQILLVIKIRYNGDIHWPVPFAILFRFLNEKI